MAKNKSNNTPEAEATDAVETAPKGNGRKIMLTLEDGTEIARVDYIRQRWETKTVTRSEIRKEVADLQGTEVKYQIIFAATKGIEGGLEKVAKEEAATDEAATEAA